MRHPRRPARHKGERRDNPIRALVAGRKRSARRAARAAK